jgi:hypothetical protein
MTERATMNDTKTAHDAHLHARLPKPAGAPV